ncbi:MAG: DUF4173 domain-containing protein [Gemmatimonadaceae bacterium]|nr:DUF4173 domain-containing protein [Gemmatimonadaceae bacterium]
MPALQRLVVAALVVGISGDVLLRGGMWRLGFAMWIAILAAAVFVVHLQASRERSALLCGLCAAAFGLAWRDAPMMYSINMLSVLCMGALLIWHGTGQRIRQFSIVDVVRAPLLAIGNGVGGAFAVLSAWTRTRGGESVYAGHARALGVGVILAAPPAILVASLLASSDVIFGKRLEAIGVFLAADAIHHTFVAAVLSWLAVGWLRGAAGDALSHFVPAAPTPAVPLLSVSVILGAQIAVLALFCFTQLETLFGGHAFLLRTEGLSLATYAREGFFEVVVAAGMVVGTLVVSEWLLGKTVRTSPTRLPIMGAVLLVCVAMLLVSGILRITLYVREFGMTVDRALAGAGVVWVAAIMIIAAFTTLRQRGHRFMPLTLGATIAWVAVVNLINLEGLVARYNIHRARTGATFDVAYHTQLSADALPALVTGASRLSREQCTALTGTLAKSWEERLANPETGGRDWRSRNWPIVWAQRSHRRAQATCDSPAAAIN